MMLYIEAIIFWILIPSLVFFYIDQNYVSVLTNIIGYAFILVGVLLALYSSLVAYIQNGEWSTMLTSNDRLIVSGPYRFIRHPVSTGYMIYLTGIFFLSLSYITMVFLLSVTVFIIALQLIQEKCDEKKISNYESYREKVPAFVPFPGKKIPFDYSQSVPLLFVLMNLLLKIVVQIVVFPFITARSKEKKDTPVIFAIQHQTHYDGPAIYYALTKYFRPVGTALYVGKLPLLRKMGTIPVKRYERDMRAMRDIMSTLRSKFNIIIAPEAARSWDGERLCIRKEIWKLFKRLGVPIIPVKFNGAQRLWPRWSNIVQFGHINIEFGEPINPSEDNMEEKIISFLDKEDRSFNKRYRHYLGINRLLWRCPSCGAIGNIKGKINSFTCNTCNKSWKKPNVYEVIELHKKIRPDNMNVNFPVEDEVTYKGRKVKAQILKDRALIGDKEILFKEFRSSSIEANKENIFGLVHDTLRFLPANSALMWKEIIDYQVVFEIGNDNYHTYYWDENC